MTALTLLPGKSGKVSLGGHEKFVFRYGWLKKGADALARYSSVFAAEDAIVKLGVGKNMVRSIRFWGLAFGLFEEDPSAGKSVILRLSRLGRALLDDHGWDPYLESSATLWLLHWQLVSNPTRALVWNLAFCDFLETEFTRQQLVAFITRAFDRLGIATTKASIEREADVFLRTYIPPARKSSEMPAEEAMDCPLAALALIDYAPEDGVYHFNSGPKTGLPSPVFGYALLNFLARTGSHRRAVALDECLYRRGSPGQVFRLDENSVTEHIESLEVFTGGRLSIQESAGIRQVYLRPLRNDEFESLAFNLLDQYYASNDR